MYKVLKIGEKDYKLEYSIEAALYADCAEAATSWFVGIGVAATENNIQGILRGVSNLPSAALSMFYAGLMEHHGAEADGTVTDKSTAKELLRAYLKEHDGEETGDFYGFTIMLIEKMGEDNFFKMIGLEEMMKQMTAEKEETESAPPMSLQDHKPPKTRKASAK